MIPPKKSNFLDTFIFVAKKSFFGLGPPPGRLACPGLRDARYPPGVGLNSAWCVCLVCVFLCMCVCVLTYRCICTCTRIYVSLCGGIAEIHYSIREGRPEPPAGVKADTSRHSLVRETAPLLPPHTADLCCNPALPPPCPSPACPVHMNRSRSIPPPGGSLCPAKLQGRAEQPHTASVFEGLLGWGCCDGQAQREVWRPGGESGLGGWGWS